VLLRHAAASAAKPLARVAYGAHAAVEVCSECRNAMHRQSSHTATLFARAGKLPVAPSAVRISDGTPVQHPTTFEDLDFETPRALDTDEVATYVEHFRVAAANAVTCGFDGVEIHAGNGYLVCGGRGASMRGLHWSSQLASGLFSPDDGFVARPFAAQRCVHADSLRAGCAACYARDARQLSLVFTAIWVVLLGCAALTLLMRARRSTRS
jgi:NADH:flavin oxidoreductase / NADH oxidase family